MAVLSRRTHAAKTRHDNREALVAATLALLEEGTPFADIGIEQIVRGAGLSRPTFYKYFRDKRELILELGAGLLDAVATAADPWLESGEGELRGTLTAVLDKFREHRATLGALVEAATYDAEVNAFWHAFHKRFLDTAARRIAERQPDLPAARAEARAFALVWMTERAMTEFVTSDTGLDKAALLDELAAFWDLRARD